MGLLKKPWKKQTVACADCGYLSYSSPYGDEKVWEVGLELRSGPERRGWEYFTNVSCLKGIFNLYVELEEARDTGFAAVLAKKRDCRFFFEYQPGYDAPLHRDLEERKRRDMDARVWNGVFVLLGGALTLLVTVVVLLLT